MGGTKVLLEHLADFFPGCRKWGEFLLNTRDSLSEARVAPSCAVLGPDILKFVQTFKGVHHGCEFLLPAGQFFLVARIGL
jgi:hypothetical protein